MGEGIGLVHHIGGLWRIAEEPAAGLAAEEAGGNHPVADP